MPPGLVIKENWHQRTFVSLEVNIRLYADHKTCFVFPLTLEEFLGIPQALLGTSRNGILEHSALSVDCFRSFQTFLFQCGVLVFGYKHLCRPTTSELEQ